MKGNLEEVKEELKQMVTTEVKTWNGKEWYVGV
jgi:hypothetical protein